MKRSLGKYRDLAITTLISHFFRGKIRRGSIRAVKLYLRTVEALRFSAIWLLTCGIIGSVFVAGLVLIVTGVLALLPIDPVALAWTALGIGVLMTAAAGFTTYQLLSQKRWLELSKSYELMDAALGPWEGALPPNPVDIVNSQAPDKKPAAARAEQERIDPRPLMANARLATPLVP